MRNFVLVIVAALGLPFALLLVGCQPTDDDTSVADDDTGAGDDDSVGDDDDTAEIKIRLEILRPATGMIVEFDNNELVGCAPDMCMVEVLEDGHFSLEGDLDGYLFVQQFVDVETDNDGNVTVLLDGVGLTPEDGVCTISWGTGQWGLELDELECTGDPSPTSGDDPQEYLFSTEEDNGTILFGGIAAWAAPIMTGTDFFGEDVNGESVGGWISADRSHGQVSIDLTDNAHDYESELVCNP